MDRILRLAWHKLPASFMQELKPPKKVTKPNDIDDHKTILEVTKPFRGTDVLRPVMSGAYLTEDGKIVATDAHKMIVLHTGGNGGNRIIGEDLKPIDGRYPNWEAVFPDKRKAQGRSVVDLNKMRLYVTNAKIFANQTTHMIRFEAATKEDPNRSISINGNMLLTFIEFALGLGYAELNVYWNEPNRALIFDSKDGYLDALMMPVMLHDDSFITRDTAAVEPDLTQTSLEGIYNLNTNSLYYRGDEYQLSTIPSSSTVEGLDRSLYDNLIQFLKRSQLPITEHVAVKDGRLHVTNLEFSLSYPCIWKKGLYRLTPRGPVPSIVSDDEFPFFPKPEGTRQRLNIDGTDLATHLPKLAASANVDELRPAMSGLIWLNDHFYSTDARSVVRLAVPEKLTGQGVTIPWIQELNRFRGLLTGFTQFVVSEYHTEIHAGGAYFIIRNVDGRPPNVDAIFPQDFSFVHSISQKDFQAVVKKFSETKRKTDKRNRLAVYFRPDKAIFGYVPNGKRDPTPNDLVVLETLEITVNTTERVVPVKDGLYCMPTMNSEKDLFALHTDTYNAWKGLKGDVSICTQEHYKNNRMLFLEPLYPIGKAAKEVQPKKAPEKTAKPDAEKAKKLKLAKAKAAAQAQRLRLLKLKSGMK